MHWILCCMDKEAEVESGEVGKNKSVPKFGSQNGG